MSRCGCVLYNSSQSPVFCDLIQWSVKLLLRGRIRILLWLVTPVLRLAWLSAHSLATMAIFLAALEAKAQQQQQEKAPLL